MRRLGRVRRRVAMAVFGVAARSRQETLLAAQDALGWPRIHPRRRLDAKDAGGAMRAARWTRSSKVRGSVAPSSLLARLFGAFLLLDGSAVDLPL